MKWKLNKIKIAKPNKKFKAHAGRPVESRYEPVSLVAL